MRARSMIPDGLGALAAATAAGLFAVASGAGPAPHAWQLVPVLAGVGLLVWAAAVARPPEPEDHGGGRHALAFADELLRRGRARVAAESLEERWARHVRAVDERWRHGFPEAGVGLAEPPPAPADAAEPEPAAPPLSHRRIAAAGFAAGALAVLLWLPVGPIAGLATAAATALFGIAAYALPLAPALALDVLPPPVTQGLVRSRLLGALRWLLALRRGPGAPWRRRPSRAQLRAFAVPVLVALRERVFVRPAGVVLAALGLLHLLRDAPGFAAGGYHRAGGLAGMAVAAPLGWLCSPAGAVGLLAALLTVAAVGTARTLRAYRNRDLAAAALAMLLAVPLGAAAVGRFVGYDYYLGTRGDKVLVLAGVSRSDRHPVDDPRLSTRDTPLALRAALADGIPVADAGDGLRLAREIAHPAVLPAFPTSGGELGVGDCFSTAGPDAGLRYATPCGAAHAGEVYFVGRLPLVRDPGAKVADAAARGMCERPYGDYLGVPFGQSYLRVEPPLRAGGPWRPRPAFACWLRAVGPASLRGAKVVASLAQPTGWDPGRAGCRAAGLAADATVTLTVERRDTFCAAPGRSRPERLPAGTLSIDATFTVPAGLPATARYGVACLDADAASGYAVAVAADGGLEVWRQAGTERRQLATAKPKRALKPGTPLDAHVACTLAPGGAGIDVTATVAGASVHASDRTPSAPGGISPRLFVDAHDGVPVAVAVSALTATAA